MRNPRLSKWQDIAATEGLLFVAQRIEEALFDYTFDSYKVPALNTHTRALELSQNIDDAVEGRLRLASILPIVKELAGSVRTDVATAVLLGPSAGKYSNPAWWEVKAPGQLRIQVDSPISVLGGRAYERQICREIGSRIGEAKKKDELYALVTSLVGEWLRRGFSKEYIFWSIRTFFFSPWSATIADSSAFDKFVETFAGKRKKYRVMIRASGTIGPLRHVVPDQIASLTEERPQPRTQSEKERLFIETPHDGVYVTFPEIEAMDPSAARDRAVSMLSRMTAILACHFHRDLAPESTAALVYEGARAVSLRATPLAIHKYRECSSMELPSAFIRTLDAIVQQQHHSDSLARHSAAINLHAAAVASRDSAVQLTTLWSALEALLPIPAGDVKVSAVSRTVLPLLLRNYPLRLVAELERSLRACVPVALESAIATVSQNVPAELRCATIVAVEQCKPAREILYAALSKNPLLKHRLYGVHKLVVNSKNTLKAIDTHQERVEWQIRRIYRARNLLVHSGRSPPYLSTVIENLHSYLHVVFDGIEERCAYGKPRTIDAAFMALKLEAEAHSEFLRSMDETATTAENLVSVLAGPVLET